MLKRIFDVAMVVLLLPLISPLGVLTFILVKLTSKGPALYWSKRVGIKNQMFSMPKFRSMRVDTPVLATHILNQQENPNQYITPVGAFIRKSSLDEIPQLWCVLIGEMSIVGPRPALFNQDDLIQLRTNSNIHALKPGITGWAQINGRDEISILKKVELDVYYLKRRTVFFDCYIIFLTVLKVLKRDDVSH